ncbi:velvet factor-domain-containing protein, partial [Melanogaster broomeanus]
MDTSTSYSGIPTGYPYERERSFHERDRLEYELKVRQEPKQARMCGVGADRRPIDPPPIIQLRVIDPHTRQPPSPANPDGEDGDPNYAHSFLQNPYYFMFASLAKPDDDTELHWLKDNKTRCTTGSVVSSLYHLKDTENRNEDAGFFVFPDLSVRTEGSYRLKLSLFEVVGNTVRHCKSIYSQPFYVYTAKKFPGMEAESTPLSCSLADQGIKIRIRKDIRVRKRPIAALAVPLDGGQGHGENGKIEDEHGETDERQHGHQQQFPHGHQGSGEMTPHTPSSANPGAIALPGLPAWPTATTLDPMLGVASAPGGIELTAPTLPHAHGHPHSAGGTMGSTHQGGGVPPPPGAVYEGPRISTGAGLGNIPPGAQLLSGSEGASSGSGATRNVQPLSSSSSAASSSFASANVGASAGTQNLGGERGGYDHPQQQRGSYESRGNYDPQSHSRGSYDAHAHAHAQRASYSAPYDAPAPQAPTYQDGHNHGGYTHPHNPPQHTSANYSQHSPTDTYPGASSHTHSQGQYSSLPRSQYPGPPPGHTYPGSYPPAQASTQGRYDYPPPSATGGNGSGSGGSGGYYDPSPPPQPSSSSS